MRSSSAPVNAPRRCPNSSDSIRVGESAERFTAWKHVEKSSSKQWRSASKGTKRERPIARATSSLPVPVSPVMSVGTSPMRPISARR